MAWYVATESEPWVTFLWNIKNYSYCWSTKNEHLSSPEFKVESSENTTWKLMLYPKGREYSNSVCCDLQLLSDKRRATIKVMCEIAFLAENGSVLKIKGREYKEFKQYGILKFENFAEHEDLTKTKREAFLSGDTLRTRCRLWRSDIKAAVPTTIFARTVLNVEKNFFIWDIVRFTSFSSHGKCYYFIMRGEDKLADIDIEMKEYGNIVISIKNLDKNIRYLIFRPFITDKISSRIDCGKCEMSHSSYYDYVTHPLPFTVHNLIRNKDLYLKNNILSLYCEFSWTDGVVNHTLKENFSVITPPNISDSVIPKPSISSPCTGNEIIPKPYVSNDDEEENDKTIDLIKDIENLYVEGILCDVQLRTATGTFPAHKVFLCARSPVFRQMFTTDMKEKIQGCVDVPDLEDDTVRRMLQYIYTDALEDLQWESTLRLYAAADKYEIVTLKTKCSSFLKRSLCPSNLCDILVLADRHVDDDLKQAAQNFALQHQIDVFRSEEWAEFMKANSSLAMETMIFHWKRMSHK
ncbi:BTB and MATH domain-containing protein 42 [Nephila pilipes]|uniref:BTB and MATH domain-containing protein 42 n=1 Tax=Nephila pilipes TaxID=299642 RepID=A0A8X6JC84_NEPPI|nr:BTB and MATH domain-containing protein 42 [Nephila pilipes]